jgi:hypothetical protein
MTRAELREIFSAFGPISKIVTFRQIISGTFFSFSPSFIQFETSAGHDAALLADLTRHSIQVAEVDPFFTHPAIVAIYGIPRCESPLSFCEHFTAYGGHHMRVIEKVSGWGDSIILCPFESVTAAKQFRDLIDGSFAHGKKLTAIPFAMEEDVCCNVSYPHVATHLGEESCFDFRLLYYDQVFACWSGAVIALSGTIAEAALAEPDLSEFVVPRIPGPFGLFVDFFRGRMFQLSDRNCVFVHEMAKALAIPQLSEKARRFIFDGGDLESAIVILDELFARNLDTSHHLPLVASQLKDLQDSLAVQAYPAELLELLISSPYSSLESEDAVYEFIAMFTDFMPEKFRHLVRQVRIDRLTNEPLLSLLSDPAVDLNHFRIGLLHVGSQLKFSADALKPPVGASRLATSTNKIVSFGDLYRAEVIEMENGCYFAGVFAALKRRFGDNLLSQEVIQITASSVSHMTVAVLLDSEPTEYFGTNDQPNSWIMINFRTMKLSLTGYAFRTHSHQGNGHIKGWVIEGHDERGGWRIVDQRADVDNLQALGKTAYFRLSDKSPYYQIFRIRQTQKNSMNYDNLRLAQIELFGSLQTDGSQMT